MKGLTLPIEEDLASPTDFPNKRYVFPANNGKLESITLEKDGKDSPVTLVARIDGADQRIVFGRDNWQTGRAAWVTYSEQPVAASGGWTAHDTFTGKICLYETPYIITVNLKYTGDELQCTSKANVRFGGVKRIELQGKVEAQ